MQDAENTVDETIDTVQQVEDANSAKSDEVIEETKTPLSPEQHAYEDLKVERIGKFKVGMAYEDARYYRNLIDKSAYVGPQQAYLLIVAKAELSQLCDGLKDQEKGQRYEVELSSACIESIGFFMNKYEGKGEESAMRLFSASMLLRPAMGLINDLDAQLEITKTQLPKK